MTGPAATPATGDAVRRSLGLLPAFRRGLGLTVFLSMVGTAMQIVVPIVVQQIVDREILAPGGPSAAGILTRGGAAVAAILGAAAVGRVALIRLTAAAATGLSDLRVRTFRHLHRLSILHVEAERRGSLVSRVTSDVATLQDFMDWAGVSMLIGASQVGLAVTVMSFYRWQLAVLVVGGVMVYAILLWSFQRILSRAHDRVRERIADSLSALGEAISGLTVVRAFGAEGATLERVDRALQSQFRSEFRTALLGNVLFSSAEVFAGAITASVVGVGVWLGAAQGVSAGTLLAFLFLVNLLVEPVQMMVETLELAQSAGSGLRRILGVLDTPVDVPDPVGGVDLPPGGLGVEVSGLHYRYPGGPEVLGDISVAIAPGARVAVVGETGSGKTTFAKLVARLLEASEGEIRIGGLPVSRVREVSLRSRVAFVPQEGFLFEASIADNVRYGRPQAGDEEVRAAFADLGLEAWLEALPEGSATQVGERGGKLSAGERQLVALVRAWIAAPDLLVLDEATSAVDPALEVQLRGAIDRLIAGRTSITVAHRLSTAEACDEILVFDRGMLVERGTHHELLGVDGRYARLHADWAAGATGPG